MKEEDELRFNFIIVWYKRQLNSVKTIFLLALVRLFNLTLKTTKKNFFYYYYDVKNKGKKTLIAIQKNEKNTHDSNHFTLISFSVFLTLIASFSDKTHTNTQSFTYIHPSSCAFYAILFDCDVQRKRERREGEREKMKSCW